MSWRKCFEFTGEERFFQGHFPEVPILPGVMQLEFAHRFAEEVSGRELRLREVRKVKFADIISPKDKVVLELAQLADDKISYRFLKGDRICSSGVLVY